MFMVYVDGACTAVANKDGLKNLNEKVSYLFIVL